MEMWISLEYCEILLDNRKGEITSNWETVEILLVASDIFNLSPREVWILILFKMLLPGFASFLICGSETRKKTGKHSLKKNKLKHEFIIANNLYFYLNRQWRILLMISSYSWYFVKEWLLNTVEVETHYTFDCY